VDEALAQRLRSEGIRDERVVAAMSRLDRARFIPPRWCEDADRDRPVPIGHGQTTSQPSLVALMTELLHLQGRERVLEIGTGSGYQAAILAALCAEVFSVERIPELAEAARALLVDGLGLGNVRLRVGDGGLGWPEAAPFERIVVTAAAAGIPEALLAQLAPGGRLVIPVGSHQGFQWLRTVDRDEQGALRERDVVPVRFVPLVQGAPAGQ
jgi:protein-L-isoaspartate(D-aspartate) O-methyltransferase